jgi:hypothetical protein
LDCAFQGSDESEVVFNLLPGTGDFAFILSGTEICSLDHHDEATIFACGTGIRFDIVGTRNWSVQVIAFYWHRVKPIFIVDGGGEHFWQNISKVPGKRFGELGNTTSAVNSSLLSDPGILDTIPSKCPFFYLVKAVEQRCVFLNQVFHGRESQVNVQVRPVNVWVDYVRKLEFYHNLNLCKTSPDALRADIYFAVIFHVPCFVFERTALLPAVDNM